jgi:ribosomal protein L11 methylase PrmA
LTLAGAALGVDFCLGVDLSRQAVRLTRENARENGLAARMELVQGSTECLRGPFEVVLANLRWPVQMAKVAELDRLAAKTGALILSGFRDVQEAELLACYQDLGWSLQQRLSRDEWAIEVPPERSFTWVAWLLQRR